jgi:hypothetical protein
MMSESDVFEFLHKIPWDEVPEEKYRAWADAFKSSQESLNLSVSCPLCNSKSLHRWYEGGHPTDRILDGTRYVARNAGLWQWCSSCGALFHASADVPEWWNPPLDIEIKKENLRVIPWAIEEARCAWEEKRKGNSTTINAGS